MTFCIITHVPHCYSENNYFGYAPYVHEMNIWLKNIDKVIIVAPLKKYPITAIHQSYNHNNIQFIEVPDFSLTSFKAILKAIFVVPIIFFRILNAMSSSNHIHLRCPGNMGLLGSFAQIFFSSKTKTAKYAGNWDAKSKQPLSYQIQKWILSNTFLTKKMSVLVYGEWNNQTKNIKSFFTATYRESEKEVLKPKDFSKAIHFLFVGTLVKGKQPLYAIKLIEQLKLNGKNVQLSMYGNGSEKNVLQEYINSNSLTDFVSLKGTTDKEAMKKIYQDSHFLILPSKSEGWPKVVAEAMFFGCLPIATKVSCVPNMLDYGNRGILLNEEIISDAFQIEELLSNQDLYNSKINAAINWSRNFTIDKFEDEIKKLLA